MVLTPKTLLVAGFLAVSLCGCKPSTSAGGAGAPVSGAAPAATPNACDILTPDIAKKYLGDGAQLRRKAQPNPKMTQCQWGSDRGVITIMVGPWDMIHTATSLDKPQTGVGDEAYSSGLDLDVRKGDRGIEISIIVAAGEFWGKAADDLEAKTLAAEIKIAPDLLARL